MTKDIIGKIKNVLLKEQIARQQKVLENQDQIIAYLKRLDRVNIHV